MALYSYSFILHGFPECNLVQFKFTQNTTIKIIVLFHYFDHIILPPPPLPLQQTQPTYFYWYDLLNTKLWYVCQLPFAIKMPTSASSLPRLALVVHFSSLPHKSIHPLIDTTIFYLHETFKNFTWFPLLNPFSKHCSDNRHCLEHWRTVTSI